MIRSFKILLIILPVLSSDLYSQNAAATSVLSKGNWFKIAVTEDGVYRIDYSKLKQIGLTNPSYPKLYGNNWGQLSYYNNPPKPDDLKEMAIYISGNDDVLNEGEYLLFFGKASHRWVYNESDRTYSYLRHNYSDTAYYFLTSDESGGKRITAKETTLPATGISISSDALFIHEYESVNLKKSGREWFQPVPVLSGLTINPGFSDLITTEPVRYKIRVAARAAITTQFRLNEGNTLVKNIPVPPVNLYNYTGTYANITEYSDSLMAGSSSSVLELKYLNNGTSSENAGWLDYLTLHGRKRNIFNGTRQQYSDSKSVAPGSITEFRITSSNNNAIIWEVSDQFNIKMIGYTKSGETMSFRDSSHILKTYIAFTASSALSPVIRSNAVPNQDLHGSPAADMIIVTHPLFLLHAQKLADIHQSHDGLVSYIVTPEQIYNEFSGGIPDIAAIRNFVRFKYLNQKNRERPLKYLLLFGDGSYENKTLPPDNPNFILTYQSQNSNVVVSSFTSDDFYGLLDDNEGEADGTEDIGIGRLPVSDTTQAGIVISKIQTYIDPVNMGDWKNIICLVADDEDGNTHLSDAEGLARIIQDSVPAFNIDKIYLDAFRQSTSANGQSYPNVNQAINDRINSGCLIFNYVGHGSENGLAHEGVLKPEDINSWQNAGKLPLFITATCEFSRFDDSTTVSAGEWVLLNPTGGGIALFSTSRLVYSSPNFILNREFYNCAFKRHEDGSRYTLGDIMRITKNAVGEEQNKLNFTLLGDPALVLSYPDVGIRMDEINGKPIGEFTDTIKALSRTSVKGHIIDLQGNKIPDFNGIVMPSVYDKEIHLTNMANDGGPIMEFTVRNSILFRGKASVKNGEFSFNFMVPKDIAYQVSTGKFSFYGKTDTYDGHGVDQRVRIGGSEGASSNDQTGPQVGVFLNDTTFAAGGICNETPVLLIRIQDESGVNTTGNGIGHDITATLDGNQQNVLVLNDYYESDLDEYRSGTIRYPFGKLSHGEHLLRVKVWDIVNNSTESELHFNVTNSDEIILDHVLNYPNPFTTRTDFYFEHNQGNQPLDVLIQVFTIGGKLVKSFEFLASDQTQINAGSFRVGPVTWDGLDDFGDRIGRGTYFYRVRVRTNDGKTKDAFQKLVILK
ncbi:MAG TPA: hypothetical protein DC042_03170 [Bacteroidales bacterium]|nr:hypothetical protein [Bacteroidales bacterium]